MKTFLIVGCLLIFQQINAQQIISEKTEQGIQHYLYSHVVELNQIDISIKLVHQQKTNVASYFTYQVLFQEIPIYNNILKIVVDKNFQVISFKKELNNLSNLNTLSIENEVALFSTINISSIAQQLWHSENALKSSNYQLYYPDEKPLLCLVLQAWNKSLDESVWLNNKGETVFKNNYARQLKKDSIVSVKIFNPDPITTLNKNYGGIYIDDNDVNAPWMNGAYFTMNIPVTFNDADNTFYLENGLVKIEDFESPTIAPATSTIPSFSFTRDLSGFEDCNALYHITKFHQYIAQYGYDTLLKNGITVDAHGQFGLDNSVFMRNGGMPTLSFGIGGIDDAEDADVIIHEYSHGLSWSANGNDNFSNERAGLDEGLADYFATSYSRFMNNYNWEKVFNWDGNYQGWNGRIANTTNNYGSTTQMYEIGEIWNSALSSIWTTIGNTQTDVDMLEAMHFFTNNTTLPEAAMYFLKSDSLIFNGINTPAICAAFQARGIFGGSCNPVDVKSVTKNLSLQIKNTIGFATGNSSLNIEFEKPETFTAQVVDLTGKIILNEKYNATTVFSLSPNLITTGIYFLKIQTSNQQQTFKISKW